MTAVTGKQRACGPSLHPRRAVASAVNFHQMVAGEFGTAGVLFEIILHQIVI
jgi:hypothetical protein